MVNMSIALVMIHVIFTALGFHYITAELSRAGNEQLLNNLDEGVIILA